MVPERGQLSKLFQNSGLVLFVLHPYIQSLSLLLDRILKHWETGTEPALTIFQRLAVSTNTVLGRASVSTTIAACLPCTRADFSYLYLFILIPSFKVVFIKIHLFSFGD